MAFLTCHFFYLWLAQNANVKSLQTQEVIMFTVLNSGNWAEQYETIASVFFSASP
jgi:ABC-type proline/glycine betaine transport system permease subunit